MIEMAFNSVLLVSIAKKSAELWQQLACLPERISSDEMVDLVICFPLQRLGRWTHYVWTYLCVSPYPQRHHHYATSYYNYGDDSDNDSDDDEDGGASSSSWDNEYHAQCYCYSSQIVSRGYDSSSHSD